MNSTPMNSCQCDANSGGSDKPVQNDPRAELVAQQHEYGGAGGGAGQRPAAAEDDDDQRLPGEGPEGEIGRDETGVLGGQRARHPGDRAAAAVNAASL